MRGDHWHLVSRGQRHCLTSPRAQAVPSARNEQGTSKEPAVLRLRNAGSSQERAESFATGRVAGAGFLSPPPEYWCSPPSLGPRTLEDALKSEVAGFLVVPSAQLLKPCPKSPLLPWGERRRGPPPASGFTATATWEQGHKARVLLCKWQAAESREHDHERL